MPQANDILDRRSQIRLLFADDNMLDATRRLMDFVVDFSGDDSDYVNEVTVISSNFNRWEKRERRATANFQEIEQSRNKLLYQALELMDRVIALQAAGADE